MRSPGFSSPAPSSFLLKLRVLCVCAATVALAAHAAHAETLSGYYRFPALHNDTLVFTAEGDLWRVAATGGAAQRLTTHTGSESLSAISADGRSLAFTGHYEGQPEVYTMPLSGGLPNRLTYEGESTGALVRGWTADGKVLYSTRHFSTLPGAQLVAIDPSTLQREWVRLAQADEAVYDDSGDSIIFTRLSPQSSHAKRYKGGTAQQLWRWGKDLPEAIPLTADYEGTSRWPLWWQSRVYFASDRDGTMNLWSMTLDGKNLKQLTKHADFGVKSPSLSRGRIAYQNGADLWLLDLATGKNAIIPITLTSDFDHTREKWITKPMDYLTHFSLSPTGDRVALTVRGQVFVAPASTGRLAALTRESGVRYREANFTGDGKSLLVLSDESGEVEFWRMPATGIGERTQLTKAGDTLRVQGIPSPDGNWIVSAERSQELLLFNLKDGSRRRIAASRRGSFDSPQVAWSPDNQWIAYVNDASNDFSVIHLYSIASDKSTAVTSPRTSSFSPVWSPDGKWLYFLSERALQSVVSAPWGLRQPEPFLDKPVKIYQIALSAATKRSPFQPADEVSASSSSSSADEPKKKAKESGDSSSKSSSSSSSSSSTAVTKSPPVNITLSGISGRLWEVPVAAGNYSRLTVSDKALFVLDRERGGDSSGSRLRAIEIKNKDVELVTVADAVTTYRLSDDTKKLLLRRTQNLYVVDSAPRSASLEKARVNLDALKFSFQPRESWRQMFTDAWRLHRDYFYDKGMHGVDWRANLDRHLPLVERVTDRAELNDALAYMMSELSALHTAVEPGDIRTTPDEESVGLGSLGGRLVRDDVSGGYKIADIYRADPDYPEKLSPLQRPGQSIAEGDVVTSINGIPALSAPDPGALLRNQAGRQVLLNIKPADGRAAFDTVVRPLSSSDAASLRYSDWELSRRLRVEQKGAGKIGYLHLRAMGEADYAQWARDYYPVIDRSALIVDLRHNRGGNIESWLISRLMRRPWMWWTGRAGEPYPNMQNPFRGHLVVLVNEWTASDGETMANGVRRLGLGTIIGTRTWGGGIWLRSGINRLVDRGYISAAENGSFVADEGWVVEGPGITPDIVVDNPPVATFRGEDAQLDAAIAKLQELLVKDPRPIPTPPAPVILKKP
ncbi:MAG: S41 family peptidase [Verrucomicrobiota bacterium]